MDQLVVNHLVNNDFQYFDMNDVHRRGLAERGGNFHAYMKQFMVNGLGHYNPTGNHLFAYSIREKLAATLRPSPAPYTKGSNEGVDFQGYLPRPR